MNEPKKALTAVLSDQTATTKVIQAAKAALLEAVKNNTVSPLVGTLKPDDASLAKLGLSVAERKTLLKDPSLTGLAGELLMRMEKKREERNADGEKAKHKQRKIQQEQKYGKRSGPKPPEADQKVDAQQQGPDAQRKTDKNPAFDEPEKSEIDFERENPQIETENLELEDIKNVADNAEALNDVDVGEWQNDLMEDIKAMPSVGDQAAWLFVVAQLDLRNIAFRNAGAAHLMANVKNGLLSTEDQILARAGADALRDPNNSAFAAMVPSSMTPQHGATPQIAGNIHRHKDEDELLQLAIDQTNEPHAPFSLIDDGGGKHIADLAERAQAIKPLLAIFKDSGDMTDYARTKDALESQNAYEAPQKAKSIFGDMDAMKLKPTESFFRDVLGKASES